MGKVSFAFRVTFFLNFFTRSSRQGCNSVGCNLIPLARIVLTPLLQKYSIERAGIGLE